MPATTRVAVVPVRDATLLPDADRRPGETA